MGTLALYQNRLAAFEYDSDWIIKFPSSDDSKDVGKQEYDYALCAVECGLEMEKVGLFPSEKTKGYFGTRRFDRDDHSKNFTFLYREPKKKWVLSPVYDLTYSSSIGGEHATAVNGNGISVWRHPAQRCSES